MSDVEADQVAGSEVASLRSREASVLIVERQDARLCKPGSDAAFLDLSREGLWQTFVERRVALAKVEDGEARLGTRQQPTNLAASIASRANRRSSCVNKR